jgi:hypothetical protein
MISNAYDKIQFLQIESTTLEASWKVAAVFSFRHINFDNLLKMTSF